MAASFSPQLIAPISTIVSTPIWASQLSDFLWRVAQTAQRSPLPQQLGEHDRHDDQQNQPIDDGPIVDVGVDAGKQPQPAWHDEEAARDW